MSTPVEPPVLTDESRAIMERWRTGTLADPSVENAPVEGKVWAATAGAGAGSIISAFLIWLLGVTIWHAPADALHVLQAAAAVPSPVTGLLMLCVTVGGTFVSGYLAKHTPRPSVNEPAGDGAAF